jgi:osmotically-inducible protein OsmY
MRSDSEIERDVREELKWDPDLDADDIAVSVKNGVVTLAGFVPSYSDRLEAEAAAKRVAGVLAVRSWIEREEAERVAWWAPGITKVEDRIVVSP